MGDIATSIHNPVNILRRRTYDYLDKESMTWYRLAEETGIRHASLYRFRDGGGLDGDNTLTLMNYLKIELEDLK